MSKKYRILLCLCIPSILLIIYSLNAGETKPTSKTKHSHVASATKSKVPPDLAESENTVAAILIMPKSYLPSLEQFSNSVMAKNITILRAQLESKDGQITAVYKKKEKRHGRNITPADGVPGKINDTILQKPPGTKNQIAMAGFIYFLASMQKSAILH